MRVEAHDYCGDVCRRVKSEGTLGEEGVPSINSIRNPQAALDPGSEFTRVECSVGVAVIAESEPAQERRAVREKDITSVRRSSRSEATVIMMETSDFRNGRHSPHRGGWTVRGSGASFSSDK